MNIHRRVLVFNEAAGSGPPPEHIFDEFERVPVAESTEALSERTLDSDTLVAVWGGDGTCRSVAGLLNGTNAALLPCPGGTHNHFARAAGIESVDDVEKAIHSESTELVDVGMFGNEVFLNNANVGWYVDLVERRQRFESKMPRKLAKGLALLMQLGRTRRFRVDSARSPYSAGDRFDLQAPDCQRCGTKFSNPRDKDGGTFVHGFPNRYLFLVVLVYVIWAPLAARGVTAPPRTIQRPTPGVGQHRDVYLDKTNHAVRGRDHP